MLAVVFDADEFVAEWNGRRLSAKYYAGMSGGTSIRRTKHQWGIRQGRGLFCVNHCHCSDCESCLQGLLSKVSRCCMVCT